MKISQSSRSWGIAVLVFSLMGAVSGCGSVKNEASGVDGSVTTTVGGTIAVGGDRTIKLTTNRNEVKVKDTALITVSLTCTSVDSKDCICATSASNIDTNKKDCTLSSGALGTLVFAARPTEFDTTAASPQKSTSVTANYSISPAATISQNTNTLTLAEGTRAVPSASPPVATIPGETTREVIFSVTLTGAETGSAIFTAQSQDTVASLIVKVF